MAEQTLKQITYVIWTASTPPTKGMQGPAPIPGTPRTPLIPLASLEVSKEANYLIAPPALSFDSRSICRSLLLELLTAL